MAVEVMAAAVVAMVEVGAFAVVVSVAAALVSVIGARDMAIPTATPVTTTRPFAMLPGAAS